MRVFLIHIRDPQFYALPTATRAPNGNVRVMGFPPIGIMALSAVLKRAGHECVMFDQANPDTPTSFIMDEIRLRISRSVRDECAKEGEMSRTVESVRRS